MLMVIHYITIKVSQPGSLKSSLTMPDWEPTEFFTAMVHECLLYNSDQVLHTDPNTVPDYKYHSPE